MQGVGAVPGGAITTVNLHLVDLWSTCARTRAHGRQAGLQRCERTVCLVVLSDLLSFPVRVLIQAGALCWSLPELSRER